MKSDEELMEEAFASAPTEIKQQILASDAVELESFIAKQLNEEKKKNEDRDQMWKVNEESSKPMETV